MNLGKVPPQAIEAERAVLGALLIDNVFNDCQYVLSILKPIDFYTEIHQKIYNIILELKNEDEDAVTDIIVISDILHKKGLLDSIGGAVYLMTLTSTIDSPNKIITHARIIKEKSLYRQLIELSSNIENMCYDSKDLYDIIYESEKKITEISDFIDIKKSKVNIAEISKGFIKAIDADKAFKKIWNTGWKKFDKYVGISEDKIMLLAGAAKEGKSKWVSSLMFKLLDQHNDISIFWITLEDSARDILINYFSYNLYIKGEDIKTGFYDKELINPKLKELSEKFGKYDIEFIEENCKILELKSKFVKFCKQRRNRLNILIIDNILSLADREDFKGNDNGMYDFIMAETLSIRQSTKGLIIPIHHYKDAQGTSDKLPLGYRPILSDMKGTEAFKRTPNQVLLSNNPGKHKDLVLEYPEKKDILPYIWILDVGANRSNVNDDYNALIHFIHSLDYNVFQEI